MKILTPVIQKSSNSYNKLSKKSKTLSFNFQPSPKSSFARLIQNPCRVIYVDVIYLFREKFVSFYSNKLCHSLHHRANSWILEPDDRIKSIWKFKQYGKVFLYFVHHLNLYKIYLNIFSLYKVFITHYVGINSY